VKKKFLFVATLAVAVVVGIIAVRLIVSLIGQPIVVHTSPQDKWIETEETMLARMHGFQERLDQLEKVRPDSLEALSRQMEAQRGIEDLLTKYREAQQAKIAPYLGVGGTVVTALIGGIGGIGTSIVTLLVARKKPKSTPHASTGATAR
jgi:hypothetical protein